MKRTKSFDRNEYKVNKKIIVYGAGRYGELAYWGLKSLGFKVDFFVDKNRVGENLLSVNILSPEELSNYCDEIILIASYNYFGEILEYVQNIGAKYVYDVLYLLMLDYDESVLSEYLKDEKHNYKKYQNVIENVAFDKLIINHCEIVVTECCSLKCRDCANLIQYYNNPMTLDEKEIIKTFGNFIETVDALLDLRILGGEPFLYNELDQIIVAFAKCSKIKRIAIYTNSTILPKDRVLRAMKNWGICVHMSNYGQTSSKVQELDKLLSDNGIEHYIHDYEEWHDVGNLDKRNYSQERLNNIFDNCIMGTCYTFYRGKFYLCPRSAHGERLGCFKNGEDEFVDFHGKFDINSKRLELRELIYRRKYITACDYCNGSSVKSKAIPAAIQCEKR